MARYNKWRLNAKERVRISYTVNQYQGDLC